MSYTPMIQQYLDIKQNYKETILFFRLGDFYEMFFEDAVTASGVLEITLTGRDAGQAERVPMCGIPYHAAETYIARLIQKGFRVAICEQVEDPSSAKGIVRREVVRVITPGTVLESSSLEEKSHNFLVSVAISGVNYGLAVSDVSTGFFQCTQFSGQEGRALLLDELERLSPAEIIIPFSCSGELNNTLDTINATVTLYSDESFTVEKSSQKLSTTIGDQWREELEGYPLAISAAGSLLSYLHDTQKKEAGQIKVVALYSSGQFMMLDRATRRNLELSSSIRDGGRWGTLIWVLDHTKTAMGGRLLRTWIDQPLNDADKINSRLDALEELKNKTILRYDLKELLAEIYDLERLASKAVYGSANARDLQALKNSLKIIPDLINTLKNLQSAAIVQAQNKMDPLTDIYSILQEAVAEDPPATVREGKIIKVGYSQEVDRLRRIQNEGKSWLVKLEAGEKEKSGIKSLKIGYNRVFGYYFEVTRTNLNQVPSYFIRKQTLSNAERYITPELKELEDQIITAGDRLIQLEYTLFNELRNKVSSAVDRIQRTSGSIAFIDAILSLAEVAVEENYIRPRISRLKEIIIKNGRHPVVEKVLGTGKFVPNNTDLCQNNNVLLLTGPNMAGKSTYMRQVALLVLMAQIGSFIPAETAVIGIADRIYTRIGAADDLAGGQSTFMVEMMECRHIITGATERSLVIMDEVGRGTSTYDGISIARSIIEYIVGRIKARTLFSTHYHELTDLDMLEGVINYTVSVIEQDQKIIFLRKVVPGKADRSYGIHVAALAGLPPEVISRAQEVLAGLECIKGAAGESAASSCAGLPDTIRIEEAQNAGAIIKLLKEIDLPNTTPIAALNILARLQSLV